MKHDLLAVFSRANLERVLRRFTHDPHQIDDIRQDVYLAVLKGCKDKLQPPSVTYVRVAAVSKWNNELRHRYRHRRLLDVLEYEFDEAACSSDSSPQLEAMREKFLKLPDRYQHVLILKLKGCDLAETAEVMGIDPDQARQLRACAKRCLKQQLLRDSN